MVEDAGAEAPLAGIRIVELCQNVAGPYAGLILAQLGTEVVKIERPEVGDDTRQWGRPFWGDEGVMFRRHERRQDVEDHRHRQRGRSGGTAGAQRRRRFVLAAWRPGSLERRGFGFDDLHARNERLLYCSISGFRSGTVARSPSARATARWSRGSRG